MDPNATLKEMLQLANIGGSRGMDSWEADRLADLTIALDKWLSTGGFLPQAWDSEEGL